jgi:hypothetical protein
VGIVRFQLTISVDGYVAGPDQSVENPLGVGGEYRVLPDRAHMC